MAQPTQKDHNINERGRGRAGDKLTYYRERTVILDEASRLSIN